MNIPKIIFPSIDLWPRRLQGLMRPLGLSSSGMSAQQQRLETISTNLANADTTRTAEGGPYRRRVAMLERAASGGVRVAGVQEDAAQGRLVYDPGHPDADQSGYVRYPNVDLNTEIVDLMITRRVYEANASVFTSARSAKSRSSARFTFAPQWAGPSPVFVKT